MNRDRFQVEVWNDQPFEWKETFKGDPITIPAKGFKLMNFYEGHEFKSQFYSSKKLADETVDPKTMKLIRVVEKDYIASLRGEEPTYEVEAGEVFPCMLCKKAFSDEKALLKHSEVTHKDRMIVDQEAEKVVAKRKGRPPKEKSLTA